MKILVVASHSAGHILPAIAFCQGLTEKNKDIKISFITTDGHLERRLLNNVFIFNPIYFRREGITILSCYKLIALIFKAKALIKKIKPALVVGFGGYLSIPFIICAYFEKIPNFIHEQNISLGRANRFLVNFVDNVIFSFANLNIEDKLRNKASVLGLPLRKQLQKIDKKEAKKYFGFDSESFTILVMGGSQGCANINTEIVKALKNLENFNIGVIHITGFYDYERIKQAYKKINIKHRVFSFIDSMEYAFSACDMAISRAGAGTIAEIIYLRIPSILVPYPFAKGHQLDNARFLFDRNAAILIEDKFFNADIIRENLLDLKNNPHRLNQLSESLETIDMSNSKERLVEFALKKAGWN